LRPITIFPKREPDGFRAIPAVHILTSCTSAPLGETFHSRRFSPVAEWNICSGRWLPTWRPGQFNAAGTQQVAMSGMRALLVRGGTWRSSKNTWTRR
jgi:hypothetical protein